MNGNQSQVHGVNGLHAPQRGAQSTEAFRSPPFSQRFQFMTCPLAKMIKDNMLSERCNNALSKRPKLFNSNSFSSLQVKEQSVYLSKLTVDDLKPRFLKIRHFSKG